MLPAAHARRFALPITLTAIFVVECAWFIRTQSLTFDEPIHIAEGLDAWRNHRFETWNDHPTLARLWCTLPLFGNSAFRIDALQLVGPAGKISDIQPSAPAITWPARSMNVVFGIVLGWVIWGVVRRMFSVGAANFALALFVFSPSVIAHFSLATTDDAITLMVFAVAAGLLWWRTRPTWPRSLGFGVLLGLLLLAKFSSPPMFVIAVVWMLIVAPDAIHASPLRWNWGKTRAAIIVALLVLWAGYFFHISHVQIRGGELTATFPNRAPFAHKVNFRNVDMAFALPAGEYFEGLWRVSQANKIGHPAFFMGTVSQRGGFKLYYPATVLLKWPVVVLALFVAGAILLAARKVRVAAGIWVIFSFPVIYFLLAMFARFDIGDRHILPVYPFLLVVAAACWEASKQHRWGRGVVMAAVLLLAIDSLRGAPDYLAYFNIFVPRSQSYRYLTDSSLDWGQGLLALKKYEDSHPTEEIWLAYFGSVDPKVYGIRAHVLRPGEKVEGTVVVSATDLSGQYLDDPQAYRWVLKYPRTGLIDGNMLVFKTKD